MEADAVRRRVHPEVMVGYKVEVRIDCRGLAELPPGPGSEDVHAAVADATDKGATSVRLTDCVDTTHMEAILRVIRSRFPDLWIEMSSSAELNRRAAETGSGLRDAIARLMDAGLNCLANDEINLAGAEKTAINGWLNLHRAAHGLGMQTIAGLTFGTGETVGQRVDFLEAVRRLQQETGGFAAFATKAAPSPNGRELDGVTAIERLKMPAIARMFLDTVENVQANATPEGLKLLQMELRFGANDVGGIAPAPGREEDIRRIIRDAGFRPVRREMGYRAVVLN
jgi:cyclic dehypoxanthinyl futalosine synthase